MGDLLTVVCDILDDITILLIKCICITTESFFVTFPFVIIYTVAINVTFDQSTYNINEDDGPVQPVLVLSNPSSTDITVQVRSRDITATGE